MNSSLKTVGLLAVVVGLVSGLTYLMHYTSSPPTGGGPVGPLPIGPAPQLTIPVKTIEWGEAAEFEVNSMGSHDFWFHNADKAAVHVGVVDMNCACSRVEVCALTAEESRRFLAWSAATHVLTAAAWQPVLGQNPAALAGHMWDGAVLDRFSGSSERWQAIAKDGKPVAVPVAVPPDVVGLVRLSWKAEKESAFRLYAHLWHQHTDKPSGPPSVQRLEIALAFVPALRIQPPLVERLDLLPRGMGEAEFVAWSSSRPNFKLEAKAATQHPCIEIALSPLNSADRERWAANLKSRVQSGYLVRVKLHERRSDKEQLDLGPFRRKIELVSDAAAEPLSVEVTGTVRGEVVLEGSADGRLALGSFPVRTGTKKQFFLVSDQPGVELLNDITVEPPELGYLVVKLDKDRQGSVGGRTQWILSVQVPPDKTAGTLPSGTAVILKIQGDPPRRLRLPVRGTAFN